MPDEPRRLNRASLGILLILLLLAGSARLWGLGDDSLWNNEILSHERATQATLSEAYALIRPGTHPPLYPLGVLRPWLQFGDSEWMQRFPSVVFGLLTLWLCFRLGRYAFSTRVGLIAAGVLVALPLHLYYSREGRMYALLALLVALWTAALVHAMNRNRLQDWAVYALTAAASLYCHYYAGLSLLAAGVFTGGYLLAFRRERRLLLRWLGANLAALLLFLPWLPTLWFQLHNDPVSHLKALPADGVLLLPIQFFTLFERVSPLLSGVVGLAIGVLTLAGLRITMRSADGVRRYTHGLLLAIVAGTVLIAALVSLLKPIIFIRYFVGVLPAFALLMAAGLDRGFGARGSAISASLVQRGGLAVSVGALVVLLLVSVGTSRTVLTEAWRPDFKTPTQILLNQGRPGDRVLLFAPQGTPFSMIGFDYYYRAPMPVETDYGPRPVGQKLLSALNRDRSGEASVVWVVQHQQVKRLQPPEGYEVTFRERYTTRFFQRKNRISLTRLERQ
ncbi:MAG: glycosyltransferase family 39 protein [Pseudomonadota bacterium]